MNDKKDILDRATEAINAENIEAKVPDEVLKATLSKLAQATKGQLRTISIIERIKVMKSYKKLAVAAVLIIGVLCGVNFFGGSSVVFADVLQQLQRVKTVIYKISTTMDGEFFAEMPEDSRMTEMEMSIVMSDEYGMKMETLMGDKMFQLMYMLPQENVMLSIMPEQKKYIRMELNDEAITKMQQQSNDPRYMASEFMNSEYVELGRSVIDGIEVDGFEVADPAAMGGMFDDLNVTLWIDINTGWPVQIEMEVTMEMKGKLMHMVMVMHDFQWGVQIDPAEFVPDIGDDYTAMADMKMPKMDADSAIEGLRMFADKAGRYPSKLNVMSIMSELSEIKAEQRKQERQARKTARENMTEEEFAQDPKMAAEERMVILKDPTATAEEQEKVLGELKKASEKQMKEVEEQMEEKTQEMINEVMPIMAVGPFHMKLVQEKRDPVYYGENVTPEDSDLILLRWRLDSGDYSVIYGDLRTETVTPERLAELESAITN